VDAAAADRRRASDRRSGAAPAEAGWRHDAPPDEVAVGEEVRMRFETADALAILERTPPVLRAWLAGLPDAWLDANEGPETFSPREIVGHLLHGEHADWIARLHRILEHGESKAFDPYDRFAQRRLYGDWSCERLLDELERRRGDNLATVRALQLAASDLDRRGRHPDFGSVTLRELLATWVVHDLNHLGQVARVLSKQYGDAVGPWRAYLPILAPRAR
jgi:hypothetical protein